MAGPFEWVDVLTLLKKMGPFSSQLFLIVYQTLIEKKRGPWWSLARKKTAFPTPHLLLPLKETFGALTWWRCGLHGAGGMACSKTSFWQTFGCQPVCLGYRDTFLFQFVPTISLQIKNIEKTPTGLSHDSHVLPWFPCANVFLWIHTWKLTWHWKITICNRKYIFKWWIFHCHVSFRGVTGIITVPSSSWRCASCYLPSIDGYSFAVTTWLFLAVLEEGWSLPHIRRGRGKMCGFFSEKTQKGHNTQYNVRNGVMHWHPRLIFLMQSCIYLYIHVIITAYLDLFRYLSSPHYICHH